jgi:hypothetical protein
MPFFGLSLLVSILLSIHVAKTGRNLYWIMIIVALPVVGSIAYFVAEILPELRNNPQAHKAIQKIAKAIDPDRERKRIESKLTLADTIENRVRLAQECMALADYLKAEELYLSCLKGPHQHDANMMLGLAQAQFARGDVAASKKTLDLLIAQNPEFKSTDGHMLYARSLEGLGDFQAALSEYQILSSSFPGEEGRARFALMLKRLDRNAEAQNIFRQMIQRSELAPKYYRRDNRQWIELAKEQLQAQ